MVNKKFYSATFNKFILLKTIITTIMLVQNDLLISQSFWPFRYQLPDTVLSKPPYPYWGIVSVIQ